MSSGLKLPAVDQAGAAAGYVFGTCIGLEV